MRPSTALNDAGLDSGAAWFDHDPRWPGAKAAMHKNHQAAGSRDARALIRQIGQAPPHRVLGAAAANDAPPPAYAELHGLSAFSFGRGASMPQELVGRAQVLGYTALAITDVHSVAGVVRAWSALRELREAGVEAPLHLLYGSELLWQSATNGLTARVVALARSLTGWGQLCSALTAWHRGEPLPWATLAGCELLFVPPRLPALPESAQRLTEALAEWRLALSRGEGACPTDGLWLAAELHNDRADDSAWGALLRDLEARCGIPVVAAGDVHMHERARKPLQDVLTAIRLNRPLAQCGFALQANAERHLRSRARLARIYPREWLARTLTVAERCRFDLGEVQYNYPRETVPTGMTPIDRLAELAQAGARERYPGGVPEAVSQAIRSELELIKRFAYEMFFLTVHDIVRFARARGILCQGRGSAANSVVCFVLGITAVDPTQTTLLLARFISEARRHEPPDIDVDFEHERREEVIQYIYAKYGRERAALAAAVIRYRRRSALRDVGMALDLPSALIDATAKDQHHFDGPPDATQLAALGQQHGVAPQALAQWLALSEQLRGLPRHLSQHVGGFVLTQTPLHQLVVIEPAAMLGRSVIQWDKDDLESLGMLKVDVLALGMLSALRRCLLLRNQWRPHNAFNDLASIPSECPLTYAMIQRADTVGTFQVESRAQMAMLPRLKPTTFYDLVVQVAIVRPGPIQGGMVHPYLKARQRRERGLPAAMPYPQLKAALARTLGVPIFQEQVMQIAMIAAGFSGEDADRLRRAMAAWKHTGHVHHFEDQLIDGMLAKGYPRDYAARIFKQIEGFGEYGFPESHAYSFALITYASCWLKAHEPACFLAAMLNAQPLGFYSPWQLIQDAQRHGVEVRPVCVNASDWDCTLEPLAGQAQPSTGAASDGQPAVRLGLRQIKGFSLAVAERIAAARKAGGLFVHTADLAERAALPVHELQRLASADALAALAGERRQQVWQAAPQRAAAAPGLLMGADGLARDGPAPLASAPEWEQIALDHAALSFSLRRHPVALLRERLNRARVFSAERLSQLPDGRNVRVCGLVMMRQQPATAKGVVFVSLEDETGSINVVVRPQVRQAQRQALLGSRLLAARGRWQRVQGAQGDVPVCHLIAESLVDLSAWLGRMGELAELGSGSRDFH